MVEQDDTTTIAEGRDIRAELAEAQRQMDTSRNAVAREIGVSNSLLGDWIKGTYTGDNAGVEAKIIRWLDNYHARRERENALPEAPEFVETPSARRIASALSYAQLAGDIAVIYGAAGTSKTRTCKHYARTNPQVWHVTMTPATKTTVPALERVALGLGLQRMQGGAGRYELAIMNKMRGTHGLLIVDEAQHLNVDALDAMRSLHDDTEVGLALVGNETVYANMTNNNRAAFLDRLYSRIGKRVRLQRASQDDIDAIIHAWGNHAKDCVKVCREIAAKPGGLRVLTKVMRLAYMFAAGANRKLTCEDIRAAYRELGAES